MSNEDVRCWHKCGCAACALARRAALCPRQLTACTRRRAQAANPKASQSTSNFCFANRSHNRIQVAEQQREWGALYERFAAGLAPGVAPTPKAEFFWAMSVVRSRTFSGPYVATTLQVR